MHIVVLCSLLPVRWRIIHSLPFFFALWQCYATFWVVVCLMHNLYKYLFETLARMRETILCIAHFWLFLWWFDNLAGNKCEGVLGKKPLVDDKKVFVESLWMVFFLSLFCHLSNHLVWFLRAIWASFLLHCVFSWKLISSHLIFLVRRGLGPNGAFHSDLLLLKGCMGKIITLN